MSEGAGRNGVLRVAAATLLFVAAVAGYGAASPDFAQLRHPVALLGARGEPHAFAFNLCGLVLPGLLLAWQAAASRAGATHAGWTARIGLQLAMLSALAFAAQGLLPLDPSNLLAPASRWHALAWSVWWVAFVPAAWLVAAERAHAIGLTLALLVPAAALAGTSVVPAPFAQRIAFAAWFAWWVWLVGGGGGGRAAAG